MPLGKFLSSGKSFSASVVLIGHQQQPADDRQVLEELNLFLGAAHIAVEQHRNGHQEHQKQNGPSRVFQ